MTRRSLREILSPVDVVSISFLLFLDLLILIFNSRIEQWPSLLLINTFVVAAILLLAHLAERPPSAAEAHPSAVSLAHLTSANKLMRGLHRWYCYPIIIFVFREIYLLVHPIHPTDYDSLLIAVDHALFGVNPTQWLARFSHPLITEILQISYFSYYLLFIVMGVEVYRRYPVERFDHAAFLVVYGFYLSYLGYFLLPAIGPRFTLHDFAQLDHELPGIFFTGPMRAFINAGESIPKDLSLAKELAQRDVFPSGHTQMTLVVIYLAFRNELWSRWFLVVLGSLLIVGTVYLRYHYVVDVVGGVLFFLLTIWSGNKIEGWWTKGKKPDTGKHPWK